MRTTSLTLIALLGAAACGDDGDLDSNEEAQLAYLGLDESIGKSLTLGFQGFNAANSANIPPQMATGIVGGMLTITGQVDQGSSDNKGMRLRVGMVDYTDGLVMIDGQTEELSITYDTDADAATQPYLELQLRNIPSAPGPMGTLSGTLTGVYHMDGDLLGDVNLTLMISGMIQHNGTGVIRSPGSTTVTGTATNADGGTYDISLTL